MNSDMIRLTKRLFILATLVVAFMVVGDRPAEAYECTCYGPCDCVGVCLYEYCIGGRYCDETYPAGSDDWNACYVYYDDIRNQCINNCPV